MRSWSTMWPRQMVLIIVCGVALVSLTYFTTSGKQSRQRLVSVRTNHRKVGTKEQSGSQHHLKLLQMPNSENEVVGDTSDREFNPAHQETQKRPNDNEVIAKNSNDQQTSYFNTRKLVSKKGINDLSEDPYCLTTLQGKIDKDDENNWIIPDKDQLLSLPPKVLDCLYFRYTTSLQKYCAKRSRHGSILHGWNLCEDGCYAPNENSAVHVLSLSNEYVSDMSLKNMHNSKVQRYAPKFPIGSGKELIFIPMRRKNIPNSVPYKDTNLTYEVAASKNDLNILIIDVGPFTVRTIKHVIKSGILNHVQQFSIRTNYTHPVHSEIDRVTALFQLKHLYSLGFRIYWSRMEEHCILNGEDHRTGCVYIDMVYKSCRNIHRSEEHRHMVIPNDSSIRFMDQNKLMEFYSKYLSSTQILCNEVVRLGGIKDGGWNVCNDKQYRPKMPCLVYSFGIKWDFQFDDAVADAYGCEIHSFDPSMNTTDFRRSKHVWFHNKGLLDKRDFWDMRRNWTLSTLAGIREDLGHTSKTLDMLKIDIESSEWPALPEMIKSGSLRDVKQLFLEFHSHGTGRHLVILRQLYNEGFRIFWYHRNSHCRFDVRFVQYTWCNEVYFLRI